MDLLDRSKIGRKSKRKGKRVEREWANLLKKNGAPSAKRSAQVSGIEAADVIADELSLFHQEVKGAEQLNLFQAITQAATDSKELKIPIVIHKKNRTDFLITMRWQDWLKLGFTYENKNRIPD